MLRGATGAPGAVFDFLLMQTRNSEERQGRFWAAGNQVRVPWGSVAGVLLWRLV